LNLVNIVNASQNPYRIRLCRTSGEIVRELWWNSAGANGDGLRDDRWGLSGRIVSGFGEAPKWWVSLFGGTRTLTRWFPRAPPWSVGFVWWEFSGACESHYFGVDSGKAYRSVRVFRVIPERKVSVFGGEGYFSLKFSSADAWGELFRERNGRCTSRCSRSLFLDGLAGPV